MLKYYNYDAINKSVNRVDSWWSRLVLRHPASWVLYVIANYTRWTPNMLSTIGFGFVLISSISLLTGNMLLGALFFQLSLIFDFIDGRLARLKNKGSYFGEFLDNFYDQVKVAILLIALYVSYIRFFPEQSDTFFVINIFIYLFIQELTVILWLFVEKSIDNKNNVRKVLELAVDKSFFGKFILSVTRRFDRIGLRVTPSNIETNVIVFSILPFFPHLNHELFIFSNLLLLAFTFVELFIVIMIVRQKDTNLHDNA